MTAAAPTVAFVAQTERDPTQTPLLPTCAADISTTCLACGTPMQPEHAHYRCPACGWRDSCCDGPY
jgi:hypothetical protein